MWFLILDDEFIVKGLAIREDTKEGYHFVTIPYKIQIIKETEIRQDMAHPIRDKCRQYIETKVLDTYEDVLRDRDNHIDRDRGRYATPIGT
jgi:DNA-binding cell septation regulator SpoVG